MVALILRWDHPRAEKVIMRQGNIDETKSEYVEITRPHAHAAGKISGAGWE